MKRLLLCLVLLAFSATAISQSTRPVPRGVRDGEQAVQQGEQDIPPPLNAPVRPNMQQVQREANQIAALAQVLPGEIGQLAKGTRPKDLDQKLKEINKLSRRLRSQLHRM